MQRIIPRSSLRVATVLALAGVAACSDTAVSPTENPALSVSAASADETPRYRMPVARILHAINDPALTDGSVIIAMKEPLAARGTFSDGRSLPVAARFAAEAAIRSAFPGLRIEEGMVRPITYRTTSGWKADTIYRTFIVARVASSATLHALLANPYVDFLEPNWTNGVTRGSSTAVSVSTVSDNEHVSWGLDSVRARDVWALGYTGRGVNAYIVDTGVDDFDMQHPDVGSDSGMMMTSTWWDNADKTCFDSWLPCWFEQDYHGTGVYGAFIGRQNGIGSVGVSPGQYWVGVGNVVYQTTAGTFRQREVDFSDAVDAVSQYHGTEPRKVGVTSIGYDNDDTLDYQILHGAFRRSAAQGTLWFTAAGQGANSTVGLPGMYPQVIAVGGVNRRLVRRATSPIHPKIELVAPAESLVVSWNRADDYAPPFEYTRLVNGTSFGAPVAAGVARLVWEKFPLWSMNTLRAELQQHARDLGTSGKDNEYGYGMVDAFCAVQQLDPCLGTLRVGLQGPTTIGTRGTYTWEAMPTGGHGANTYQWRRRNEGVAGWTSVGTARTYSRLVDATVPSFELQVTVSSFGEHRTVTIFVDNLTYTPSCDGKGC